ncbi:single-stranded DNA-binding protein [Mycoplasma zalophidermidis]|uniref:single-stranded DNA-binding protein n=1 Tax=Mycoplasma zalophidermidis TaxID=398174 RepID=UPI00215C39CE|nr:single-stranded DNA-binding protein [Mycoplasma zalophidermidis]MCR8966881.1 single-stranded DNA-binding protein [Mycoplasma zalophidermidis]
MNKVLLTGRITNDNAKEYKKENSLWVQFNMAVIDEGKDKVDFIDVNIFNKVAENFLKYCKKGDLIEVVGKLDNQPFTSKSSGSKQYKLDVIGLQITYLSKNTNVNDKEIKEQDDTSEMVFDFDQNEILGGKNE